MKKYSIVCYLEGESKQKIRDIQNDLLAMTGSRACLDSWEPHLTVGDGVEVSESELENLESILGLFVKDQEGFDVDLKGFGGKTNRVGGKDEITTPYVLWVDVVVGEKLQSFVDLLQGEITSYFNLWYKMPEPYTPHVTVAFRDLNQEGYEKGEKYLQEGNFEDTIKIYHIALVEKLSDKDVEYKRFYFKNYAKE